MKYSLTFAAVALIAAVAAQDDTHGIPTCAVQCILDATTSATKCGEKEFSCQCTAENQKLITAAAIGCVSQACEAADQIATLSATKALCANPPADEGTDASSSVAVPSSTEAPVKPSSTEASTEPSATEAPTATTETFTAEPTSTGAVGEPETVYVTVCSSTQVPGGAAPTGGNAGNGTGTTPTGPATPTFTGAGAKLSAGLGSVAAFALAALAL
ncbi:hypothetical protein V500_06346 [Pseudogymnoascus sp. VKM F-4518 (FW-2643)]|nr:hypothetical protein V500_06346 [Pseudogymnoascus sp. VKM F-4518 (FW-2643)]